jgi:hypothetical protein
MSKFITSWNTTAEYDAVKDSLVTPQVALTKDNMTVHYQPYIAPEPPIIDGHEYVDLGLPSGTKWATMNVGANSIADYGNYYQYGKGANDYSVTSGESYYEGEENPLATSADTAAQVWGGSWHMPTQAQYQELIDECIWTWGTNNGVNGYTVSKNGKSIFFPAAGGYDYGEGFDIGTIGAYITSTPTQGTCYYLYFGSSFKNSTACDDYLTSGYSVRPVVG